MKLNSLKSKDSKFSKFIRILLLMIYTVPLTLLVIFCLCDFEGVNVTKVMLFFIFAFLAKFAEYLMREIAEIEFFWFEECVDEFIDWII